MKRILYYKAKRLCVCLYVRSVLGTSREPLNADT